MKTALSRISLFCAIALTLLTAPVAFGEEATAAGSGSTEDVATIIARARAYLGTEEALDALQSLHLIGTVTSDEGVVHRLEIIVRRPMQQMMIETSDKVRAVTALNDYSMWRRIDPIDQEGTGRVQLMNAQGVRMTRANVAQTLFYYKGLETVGGTIRVDGEEEADGVPCVKVIFDHPGNIRYIRFFEKATGRLVVTRSEEGAETRETGSKVVAGIKFPTGITTQINGKTSRVEFEDIRVNEEFDLAMFETPRPKFDFDSPRPSATAEKPLVEPPPPQEIKSPAEPEALPSTAPSP